jgi:hypothetical protein
MFTRKRSSTTDGPIGTNVLGSTRKSVTKTLAKYEGALATVDRGNIRLSIEYVPGPQ